MVTNDKIIKIFCATDKFSKKYEEDVTSKFKHTIFS